MIATDIVVKTVALGLVLMVVGVLADGFVVIPNHPNCPDAEGPVPVYFAHPTNCNKFYECRRKDAYEFDCPAGLHFNSRLDVCDYPLVAQCESLGPVTTETPPQTASTSVPTGPAQTPTSTQTMTPTDTPMTTTSTSAPQPTTTTPLPSTSTPQHTTTTPLPTTTILPTTYTTTTQTLETTVFPTTTNPTTSSTPSPTTTQVPVNPPTDPHCPPAGASWPNYWSHPSDCTKYLACWEGCIQQFKCPDGRYWNDGLKACDQNNWQCTCPVIPPAPNAFPATTPV